MAEPMIASGLPLIVVQPGGVYGPGDTSPQGQLLRQYLSRKLPMVPRGTALCWGHVEDTARGHVLAMERRTPGESYIIAGPVASIVDALHIASLATGIPAPRVVMPAGVTYLGSSAKAERARRGAARNARGRARPAPLC